MKVTIDDVDERNEKEKRKRIIGSMDAKSLFTSLKAKRSAEIIKEEVLNSKARFENVDIEELGIYLR